MKDSAELLAKLRTVTNAVLIKTLLATFVLAVVLGVVLSGHSNLGWDSRPFANDRGWLSCIFLTVGTFIFFRGSRSPEWDAFSPLRLFYAVWFSLLALGSLRLTSAEPPFTVRFWVTVASGLLGFYLGAVLIRRRAEKGYSIALNKMQDAWGMNWRPSRALAVVSSFFAVCLIAYVYEYRVAGGLPLFSENPEWARFNFGVNSYVHRFAISFYVIALLSYIGFVHVRKYRPYFLAMAVLSSLAIIFLTARSLLLSAIWMAIVLYHYGRRRLTPAIVLLVVFIAYPLAKIAVDLKRFYDNPAFTAVLNKIDFPDKQRWFAADYLYFSMTLQTMDNLTHLIPAEIGYSHGWYIGYPLRVFWTPREGEGFRGRLDDLFWERSTEWSPVQSVTTSYMGVPYADFGIPGVFLFSAAFGWIAAWAYDSLRRKPSFWRAFLYSEISFAIVLSIYGNYLTLFDLYWNLAVIGLVHRLASNRSKLVNEGIAGQLVLSS